MMANRENLILTNNAYEMSASDNEPIFDDPLASIVAHVPASRFSDIAWFEWPEDIYHEDVDAFIAANIGLMYAHEMLVYTRPADLDELLCDLSKIKLRQSCDQFRADSVEFNSLIRGDRIAPASFHTGALYALHKLRESAGNTMDQVIRDELLDLLEAFEINVHQQFLVQADRIMLNTREMFEQLTQQGVMREESSSGTDCEAGFDGGGRIWETEDSVNEGDTNTKHHTNAEFDTTTESDTNNKFDADAKAIRKEEEEQVTNGGAKRPGKKRNRAKSKRVKN